MEPRAAQVLGKFSTTNLSSSPSTLSNFSFILKTHKTTFFFSPRQKSLTMQPFLS